MKIALAHFLFVAAIPVVTILASLPFMALTAALKRFHQPLILGASCMIDASATGFLLMAVGGWIFRLQGVPETNAAYVLVMALVGWYNLRRLRKTQGTDRYLEDFGHAIGAALGMALGFFTVRNGLPLFWSAGVLALELLLLARLCRITRARSFPFWRLVTEKPDEAYEWFKSEGCWIVQDAGGKAVVDDQESYVGPFRVIVPKLGDRMVRLYCTVEEIEASQRRFLEQNERLDKAA
jgi:hypothetical protein